MFHGLSSNSRHLSCTEDPGIYTSISWGGKAGGESSHIFFPCFQQESGALKLHLTNHHYRLRNLQGFLNIVGLLETESLGTAQICQEKKYSFHRAGQKVSAGGKDASTLSLVSLADKKGNLTQPSFTVLIFQHYFKDCACKHLVQLSTQIRMTYMHLLYIWCIHVPEMLFKLNCSLKAAALHTSTLHPPQGLKPSPQVGPPLLRQPNQQLHRFQETRMRKEAILITTLHRTLAYNKGLVVSIQEQEIFQEIFQCRLLQELLGKYSAEAREHQQPASIG